MLLPPTAGAGVVVPVVVGLVPLRAGRVERSYVRALLCFLVPALQQLLWLADCFVCLTRKALGSCLARRVVTWFGFSCGGVFAGYFF